MQRTDEEIIEEAKLIAKMKNLFIVTKADCWLLYRKSKPRNVFIGKRSKASAVHF